MVLNHKTALDYVLQSSEYFRQLSVSKIEEVHRLLTSGLRVASGIMVGIVGTNYRPPDNGYQIKEALQYLISAVNQTENPVEKSSECSILRENENGGFRWSSFFF